jgi:hypothetical protein
MNKVIYQSADILANNAKTIAKRKFPVNIQNPHMTHRNVVIGKMKYKNSPNQIIQTSTMTLL